MESRTTTGVRRSRRLLLLGEYANVFDKQRAWKGRIEACICFGWRTWSIGKTADLLVSWEVALVTLRSSSDTDMMDT